MSYDWLLTFNSLTNVVGTENADQVGSLLNTGY